jgi:hypothetical protein
MKPHKESLAYAEKMRKRKRREKETRMSMYSGGITGAFTGYSSVYMSPYTTDIIGITRGEYESLQAEIKALRAAFFQAQTDLQERDEIIEAINADMEDIEALKEENARLKIIGCLKVKAAEPSPAVSDGWITWVPYKDAECPVPAGRRFKAVYGGREITCTSPDLGWGRMEDGYLPIEKYRVID